MYVAGRAAVPALGCRCRSARHGGVQPRQCSPRLHLVTPRGDHRRAHHGSPAHRDPDHCGAWRTGHHGGGRPAPPRPLRPPRRRRRPPPPAERRPDAEFDQALQAVYVGQALGTVREVFDREAKLGFFGYARPQPDPTYRASRIIDARRNDCVVLAGTLDVRSRYTNPVPAINGIFVLVVQTGIFPSGGNQTRWRILAAGQPETGQDLEAICPGL